MTHPQPSPNPTKSVYVIDANPDPGHATGGLGALWAFRRLLWDFVKRDLSYRYTGSAVGILWTVITPLMELITYTFVFHGLIGVSFQPQGGWTHYALFLFCGMIFNPFKRSHPRVQSYDTPMTACMHIGKSDESSKLSDQL